MAVDGVPRELPGGLALGIAGLDATRSKLLRSMMPVSSVLAAHRELRVAAVATLSMLVAFGLASIVPLWTLAIGPVVLGVPHLLADVRYCIVRPGWHRRPALVIAVGIPLVVGGVLGDAAISLAAVAGAAAASRGSSARRAIALALAAAAMVAILAWPHAGQLTMVHLHNVVAIGLWIAWRRRKTWLLAIPLLAFVGLSVALWYSATVPGLHDLAPARLGLGRHVAQLAPGVPIAVGVRIVMLFCFAQAVHYAIWLRVIPEEDRDRATPRSFRQTFRALERDLGRTALWIAAALALLFAAWAVFDLAQARDSYLRFGMFHVSLELAAAVLLFVEGCPTQRCPPPLPNNDRS